MAAVALTLVLLFAGAVYLRGWLDRRSIPVWRACSFLLGLLATWVAVVSPVASSDSRMLTAHMIQHLLLMTIAPPLIWLGEPLIAARPARDRRAGRRSSVEKVRTELGSLLGHPAFCWLAAAAALVVWHVPAIFRLGMRSPAWHFIEQASFFTTGLLFWWPVIQPWPSAARWPRWSMLLYLFLATLPCDVLSGLLVFSDRVAYPMYLCTPQMAGFSPLEDQQCAAALMWTCVTVVFVVAGTILSIQMLSPQKEAISL
ncbi:MAG TPA: cytochrome c oxidase assembly protein [Bryobacteraceae bacterium]|nr:cytochrome c oxidase assembly protein [Bryobacteraceae bacterium]